MLGLVWIVPVYLRQNLGSLRQLIGAIAYVTEIMSYPRNLFWGTVVILNLGIQDKQWRKIAGKLWAGNYPRNIFWDLLDGICSETKWNPDEDIQHTISIHSIYSYIWCCFMEHDISWIMGCSIIYILVAGGNSYHGNFTS